jgi:hypothetical protein
MDHLTAGHKIALMKHLTPNCIASSHRFIASLHRVNPSIVQLCLPAVL